MVTVFIPYEDGLRRDEDGFCRNEDGRRHDKAPKSVLDIRIRPLIFCYRPFSDSLGFPECRFLSFLLVGKTACIHYLPTPYFRLSAKLD